MQAGRKIWEAEEMVTDMFTLRDAAAILQVSLPTMRGYVKSGKLKAKKFGQVWRIAEPDLDAFLKAGCEQVDCNRRKENRQGE